MKSKSTLIIVIVIAMLFLALGIGGTYFYLKDDIVQPNNIEEAADSLDIEYPKQWQDIGINQNDQAAGVISRIRRQNPRVDLIIRTVPGETAEEFDVNKSASKVIKSLKKSINGFELQNQKIIKVGGYNALHLEYTQKYDNEETSDTLMVIIPASRETHYLTFTTAKNLTKIEPETDEIIDTFGSYIKI